MLEDLNGWVVIDKPLGPSSHEVVVWVRDILGVKKAGHAGTLDPNASGVLPIAIGKATKLLRALAKCDKEYVAVAEFERPVNEDELKTIAEEFIGKIWQMPPEMSAVRRRLRIRRIYSIEFLEFKENLVLFKTRVQHGTYIRKLISDWGELLGNPGKMAELRRIKSGPFTIKQAVTLHDLKDAMVFYNQGISDEIKNMVLPMEEGVKHLKKVVVSDSAVSALCHGANLARPGLESVDKDVNKGDLVAVFTRKNELIGLGKALVNAKQMLASKKGFIVDMEAVVMPKDKYPRMWKKNK